MSKKTSVETNAVNAGASVDFLIITAIRVERDAVLKQLGCNTESEEDGDLSYYRCTLNTDSNYSEEILEVAVTMLSQVGNTHAAEHTARCIRCLSPDFVVMVGIAGGIRDKVNLGDVVVSKKIVSYEYTKVTASGYEQRNEVESVDRILLDRAMNRDVDWHTRIRTKRPSIPNSAELPRVHFASIASGEKVIADKNSAIELTKLDAKIAAIEMESFGVAVAAAKSEQRPRFIALRGICDYADAQKNDEWHEYAADSVAAYTIGLLQSGPMLFSESCYPPTPSTVIAIHHQSMEVLSNGLTEATLPEELRPANLVHVEIDQTDLYDNGRLTKPVDAAKRQMEIMPQLYNAVDAHPDSVICYCGIAHIPLLFQIGCQGLYRMRLHFFEHNRFTKQWEILQEAEEFPQIEVAGLSDVATQSAGDIIVRISISYPVSPEAIEGVVSNPIGSVHLSIDQPTRDVVISNKQRVQYSMVFKDMLDAIAEKMSNTDRIHMFYAGPVALAVDFGRQISKTLHPKVIVYNYSMSDDPPGYAWGLEVNSGVDSQNFLIDRRR